MNASVNSAYLSKGLSKVAATRHEAAVPETSCDLEILQAYMQDIVHSGDALDTLKRVVLNNPKYPSLQDLKNKIRAMEFERSDNPWLNPPDVVQTGGKNNYSSRWRMDKFPLKVYIPTDALASKLAGYRAGDGQLLRTALETWHKLSKGEIRFVYEPVQARADITCAWVSEQKDLSITDAIGVCSRTADYKNYLLHAEIKVLTFTARGYAPSSFNDQFRKNSLEEVSLHEIGHSLGLNHSSSENDVMCAHAHWQAIIMPTSRDIAALNSLYLSNLQEYIRAALDAVESGQYKAALVPLDKAIMANRKDSQTRDTICICLNNAATQAMHKADYASVRPTQDVVEFLSR